MAALRGSNAGARGSTEGARESIKGALRCSNRAMGPQAGFQIGSIYVCPPNYYVCLPYYYICLPSIDKPKILRFVCKLLLN